MRRGFGCKAWAESTSESRDGRHGGGPAARGRWLGRKGEDSEKKGWRERERERSREGESTSAWHGDPTTLIWERAQQRGNRERERERDEEGVRLRGLGGGYEREQGWEARWWSGHERETGFDRKGEDSERSKGEGAERMERDIFQFSLNKDLGRSEGGGGGGGSGSTIEEGKCSIRGIICCTSLPPLQIIIISPRA